MLDAWLTLSDTFAARVAAAAPGVVSIHTGSRSQRTATLWRPGVLVTSEQGLPPDETVPVALPGGGRAKAVMAGRDPGTNIAVLRFDQDGPILPDPTDTHVGALVMMLGAASDGSPTARIAMVHRIGPAWDSAAGGRIDQLISLDARLAQRDEGGPVLDASGGVLGMSTLGPRRRVLVIPAATIGRVLAPLLMDGQVSRGWLGLGLQPVSIPAGWLETAGLETGLMVINLTPHGPAEQAGVLPGDILLEVDGVPAPHLRTVAKALGPGNVGKGVMLRLMRGGVLVDIRATVVAKPTA